MRVSLRRNSARKRRSTVLNRSLQRACAVLLAGGFLSLILTCASPAPLASPAATAPAIGPLTEDQKIEQLLASLETLQDAKFIRKGTPYDVKTAIQFLRGKRDWMKEEVKTARDFVEMASAGNKGTGSPYYVQFSDGRQVPARTLLTAELDRLEGVPATRPAHP